jgi:hypothetical protein
MLWHAIYIYDENFRRMESPEKKTRIKYASQMNEDEFHSVRKLQSQEVELDRDQAGKSESFS